MSCLWKGITLTHRKSVRLAKYLISGELYYNLTGLQDKVTWSSDYGLIRCDAALSYLWILAFRRSVLSSYSGSKVSRIRMVGYASRLQECSWEGTRRSNPGPASSGCQTQIFIAAYSSKCWYPATRPHGVRMQIPPWRFASYSFRYRTFFDAFTLMWQDVTLYKFVLCPSGSDLNPS